MKQVLTSILFVMLSTTLIAQQRLYYKIVGPDSLYLDIYYPENEATERPATLVFFFGGGWSGRNFDQFKPHADYFSKRGLIVVLVDYRTYNAYGTSPAAALRDAKSSIRYLKLNADNLGIDANKIVASAGGHLAAATAVIDGFNEPSDDLSISVKPNALVLFNPVLDNGPGGYGYDRVKDYYKDFSPLHNLNQGAPPTIIFLGTQDKYIPIETAQYYKVLMGKMDLRCDLKIYEGQKHGFFNYKHSQFYKETVQETDQFLQSLGYLKETPIVIID